MSKNYTAGQYESAFKPKALLNWQVPKLYTKKEKKTFKGTDPPTNTTHLPIINEFHDNLLNNDEQGDQPHVNDYSTENKENISYGKYQEKNKTATTYKPGDLTNNRTYTSFINNEVKPLSSLNGYPLPRDDFSGISTKPEKKMNENASKILNTDKEMVKCNPTSQRLNQNLLTPIIDAISNFSFAKKLHRENLEHFPLPDTITNAMYRKLQMQKLQECDPGLVLDDKPFACGMGWKGYPGYGPTRCTKLKVYRPNTTCGHNKVKCNDELSSMDSFERKWRFIRQTKVSPIDLAICWDLTPVNMDDEPKPSTHIDGSNGSQAPAVFQLVHSHREKKNDLTKEECEPIFDYVATISTAKRFITDRPKTSLPNNTQNKYNKRIKSAEQIRNLNVKEELKLAKPCNQHSCKKLNQRLCVACELKNADGTNGNRIKKAEYKMAFKAGVPQKNKNRREDYPEHWRLATVYQHSFKPLHARKKPLLQTIYL
ncbi:uncharacterized protein LOC132704458 isoform X2 [Cylas formicarius]|uniref:uncharacterized protein LOC132704458 isoform X2 n=1 Tax=Cylas formicarius TaxID=197179 RepID=UPI0029587E21|nr:uncharacterized protein LOC132704458 isoform X2 [Cylas formicarius]